MSDTPNTHGLFDEEPDLTFDRELYDAWITALRSGEYDQCRNSLSKNLNQETNNKQQTFCCLGVLVDVAGGGEWDPIAIYPLYFYPKPAHVFLSPMYESGTIQHSSLLSGDAPDYLVARATGGTISAHNLIEMNDRYNKTFAEIADVVEANVRLGGFLGEEGEQK